MQDEALERLKNGIRKFQAEVYPPLADHYQRVMHEPQQPHTLIITCADSRLHPDALTQAAPGDIFVTRNIGNVVPAYPETLGGVSAVLEFAVSAMHVKHIAVCGHSGCGAMKALLHPETLQPMPAVKAWLTHAHKAFSEATEIQRQRQKRGEESGDLLTLTTERNVLLQMRHVRSHPSVAEALKEQRVTLSGWVYDIAEGAVRIAADEATGRFEPV